MRGVKISIDAKTPQENKRRQWLNFRQKVIFIAVSIILSLGCDVVYYRNLVKEEHEDSSSAISVIMWILKILETAMGLFLVYIFCSLFYSFVRMRAYKLALKNREYSCLNKAMIMWISLLIILSTLSMILTNIMQATLVYQDNSNDSPLQFYQNHRFVFYTAIDFLKGITMVYLFKQQGKFYLSSSQRPVSQRPERVNIEPIPQNLLDELDISKHTNNYHQSGMGDATKDNLRLDHLNYSRELQTDKDYNADDVEGDHSTIKDEQESRQSDFLDKSSFMGYFEDENQFRNFLFSQLGDMRRNTPINVRFTTKI
ncbi:UNKNOWN [Stylonychia lemnae]|uniref:Transmembrane protein n=1 Tax=Stylonychia lemnae TaxID=5949 RepID=A0A078A2E3_STYLE|nr:UNKNOWN [Stylonychia lemnae]|eukprot:CDW75987.1 UNKNOWN [Stylonychia lemnae]